MADTVTMRGRVTPTAQAVPLWAAAFRAEVLHTSRKRGSTRQALIPSQGLGLPDCLRRGYDLICQVFPAPPILKGQCR